jgi:hypothetical protein
VWRPGQEEGEGGVRHHRQELHARSAPGF